MGDRSPLLSNSQFEWLNGEKDDLSEDYERTLRTRLRGRVRDCIGDFQLLYNELPEEDRQQLFQSSKYESPSESAATVANYHKGIESLLALLYETTNGGHGTDFEGFLQNAMYRVERRNGWVLTDFQFTAEFDTSGDLIDEYLERFENGEAGMEEATLLFQQDKIDDEEFTEYAENYEG